MALISAPTAGVLRPVELLTAEEMRAVDLRAAGEFGLPVRLLMEQAGFQVARVAAEMLAEAGGGGGFGAVGAGRPGAVVSCAVRPDTAAAPDLWPMVQGRSNSLAGFRVVVLAGRGNNGGDGLVAARYLHEWGCAVEVLLFGDPKCLGEAPGAGWRLLGDLGAPRLVVGEDLPVGVALRLGAADLIVDALLGTGVRGAVEGPMASAIEAANAAGRPILAVDVPSGLDADSGRVDGPCVRAAVTVTFCRAKLGLALYPGAAYAGEVRVADIGIPDEAVRRQNAMARMLTPDDVATLLPPRPPDGHKGTFGHVLVVAGSVGYAGAPALAAMGALRAGAGLVTVAAPVPVAEALAARLTEVMVRPLPASPEGGFSQEAWPGLAELVAMADVIAAGPGLGRGEPAGVLLRRLVSETEKPLVLDADGLNLLDLEAVAACRGPVVLTPHPGEMARLLRRNVAQVQADRAGVVREAARRGRCVCLLKGARTLVANPDGRLWVNPTGNSGMATAGSGDVLTGVIAGLLAQGAGPLEAALAGVYVHGKAGDLAAAASGERALVAGDLPNFLGAAFRLLKPPARE